MIAEAVANQTEQPQSPQATKDAPVVTKAPEVKEERISPKLQVLVQREKQALELERRAKQAEAAMTAREQAIAAREAKIKEFEEIKEKDPTKALSLLGLSYQDLTATQLNDGSVPPEVQVRKVEEKLDSIIKAQEAEKLAQAELEQRQAAQREEKAVTDFKGQIQTFLNADPKNYELTKFEGLEDYVYETIEEHFNRTINPQTGIGEILSIKEAADKVEAMLEKKYDNAKKLAKFQATQPPQLIQNVAKQQELTFRPKQPRTLTNQLSATPAAPRSRPQTEAQRVADVVAQFVASRR